jgi:hypothetical protein
MSDKNQIVLELAKNIITDCARKNVDVKLLGSTALLLISNDFKRDCKDIDFIIQPKEKDVKVFENTLALYGYEIDLNEINFTYGHKRRIYAQLGKPTVELFIGNPVLCQTLPIFKNRRFNLKDYTLSPTDLFLSKIQKVNLTITDIEDIEIILKSNLEYEYILKLCKTNWKWWKTLKENIPMIIALKGNHNEELFNLLWGLYVSINTIPKKANCIWKLRNCIGDKIKWYNNVE